MPVFAQGGGQELRRGSDRYMNSLVAAVAEEKSEEEQEGSEVVELMCRDSGAWSEAGRQRECPEEDSAAASSPSTHS